MRNILIILALFSIAAHAAIYKWVDKDGNVHYSDQPHPNAEVVDLHENTQNSVSIPVPKPLNLGNPVAKVEQKTPVPTYQVSIISPENDATIRSNPGDFSVNVAVTPSLASGHQLQLFVDGIATTEAQSTPIFQLHGIERGQHQIEAKVVQQNGKVLASSSAITIYMHQAGLIKPAIAAPRVTN